MAAPIVTATPELAHTRVRTGSIVAALIRLRFRVLFNSLRRSVMQTVGAIIGALYGLFLLGLTVVGMIALAFAPAELRGTILVLAGSLLVVGWIVSPLLTAGVDQTLDPQKLVVFPLPVRTLIIALAVAGILGVPGIVTGIAALSSAVSFFTAPLAALAAIPSALIGLLICVVASRAVTALSGGLSSHRRVRELLGVVILIPLALLGPLIASAARGAVPIAEVLPSIATTLSWTPLGAAWAVPVAVAAGDPMGALPRLLIALATLALLVLAWRFALAGSLETHRTPTGKTVARGKLGLLGVLPGTPTGAITARALIYWLRDPRYARQLIVVPLIPILLFFYGNLGNNLFLLNFTAPLIAFLVSLSIYADLSYDGTAFAAHVIDGVSGRADRAGRASALGILATPLVLIAAFVSTAFTGSWNLLPANLGVSVGILLGGLGLCSVSSARIVIPVPAAGDNPFKAAPGAGFTTALSAFATWGILLLLSLPVLALGVFTMLTGMMMLSWITLAVGVVLGIVWLRVGIRMGGRDFDRSAPDLLLRLKRLRGA